MTPSFWQLAVRPKWLAGLALAIVVAVLFSLFGNWQLSRSFRVTTPDETLANVVALEELAKVGVEFTEPQADRRVEFSAFFAPSTCVVVANRQQLQDDGSTIPGYWTVFDSVIGQPGEARTHVVAATAFFKTADAASKVCATASRSGLAFDTPIAFTGRYEPSEPPKAPPIADVGLFDSLSIEQLINVWPLEQPAVYPGFVILENVVGPASSQDGEAIKIGIRKSQTELNLLNAFYAIEWVLFAGFALFLWGRLIQDERKRLSQEATSSKP